MVSKKFQRVGDLVAGTIVVTEDTKWAHGLAKFEDPRVAELSELIPDGYSVSSSLAKSLALYVDRRRVLAPPRVAEIAGYLAKPLLEQFELPADTNADLLLCSLYYKTFMSHQPGEQTYNPFSDLLGANDTTGTELQTVQTVEQGDLV